MNICKKKKECEILTLHNKDIEIEEKTNKLFRKKFYQKQTNFLEKSFIKKKLF